MKEIINPFEVKSTAEAYSLADQVYELSSQRTIELTLTATDKDQLKVIDLGAGTGISALKLLEAGIKNLYLVEPSSVMLDRAKIRIQNQANYVQSSAEKMLEHFMGADVDMIYALNVFHLLPNLSQALANIACILKPNGKFVFNLSAPTYTTNNFTSQDKELIAANCNFYTELNKEFPNEILAYTAKLLNAILDGNYNETYTVEKIAQIFSSVAFVLEDAYEIDITVPSEYQKNIWYMMARSFSNDDELIQKIINKVYLPENISIKQGIFKLSNAL